MSQPRPRLGRLRIGLLKIGGWVLAVGIGLGAIGAHALEQSFHDRLSVEEATEKLDTWETAVWYHQIHGLALILLALPAIPIDRSRMARASAILFFAGLIVFSGMLYLWVLTDIRFLVMIVPLGGTSLIAGWVCFALIPFGSLNQD